MCGPDPEPMKFCKCWEPIIYTVVPKDSKEHPMWWAAIHRCKKCDLNVRDKYTKAGLITIAKMYSDLGMTVNLKDKKYSKFYTDEVAYT